MDRDIHSDPLIFRTVVASEGYRLSAETIEKVVSWFKESSENKRKYKHLDTLPNGRASDEITEGCLVLEGGAWRGLYTVGVLDKETDREVRPAERSEGQESIDNSISKNT